MDINLILTVVSIAGLSIITLYIVCLIILTIKDLQ
jgi:hypothetical protein